MFTRMINKILEKMSNKTVRLIVIENGRERELTRLFTSVSDAEKFAQSEGFKEYKIIPFARIEY